jgi:sucrose-6-phosphate hydrolase SacC (GH32 family)
MADARTLLIVVLHCALAIAVRAADDIVIADFEGEQYPAGWIVEGEAFGPGPAKGTLPNQQRVSGFEGKGLVNSYFKGDGTTGALTCPHFELNRKYINFLIGGGADPANTCVQLWVQGDIVRSATGHDDEKLDWVAWDVAEFSGKRAVLKIIDNAKGGWGHVNVDQVVLSDTAKVEPTKPVVINADKLYEETYRPQFHFTAQKGWLNDPNGLVFHNGTYHLFFQHNPLGTKWGNMTWGHAVSKDLLHWTQRPHAIERDELGDIFSGSAVIDWNDTAGFGKEALVCIYTSAGDQSPINKGKPFTQSIAYSTDGGQTFKKYEKNPVLKNISADDRDPKVFWHAPTGRWVMALYVPVKQESKAIHTIQLFGSPNLKDWTFLSRIDGFFECPDLFELPVDGDVSNKKWVLFAADGQYLIGQFDGTKFIKEAGKFKSDYGKNFYAAQTYSDIPKEDGRRILIGWMREGKYPGMPFNQQMSFPVELTLKTTAQGVRLHKWPVREIESLYQRQAESLDKAESDPLDVELEFPDLTHVTGINISARGATVSWNSDGKLQALGATATVKPVDGKLRLRLLLDRTSLELFANGGEVTMSSCFLQNPSKPLSTSVTGAQPQYVQKIRTLKSAWNHP